jgi:hypothetical protein
VERNGTGSTPGLSVRSTVKDRERTGPQQIALGTIAYEVKVLVIALTLGCGFG